MSLISYTETPIQEIFEPFLEEAKVRLLIKREDLNHPFVSGNKWWKLRHNLEEVVHHQKKLLTFGGAYSNHIYATAAAARELGIKSIGVIRGEETETPSTTLSFARECGMQLHFVSREQYRQKTDGEFVRDLKTRFRDFYLLPEGGTNELAVKGCEEFAEKLLKEISFSILCTAVGTGGTMAGMVRGLSGKRGIIGFSALRGGEFLTDEVMRLSGVRHLSWRIEENYHFGGYAKRTEELNHFLLRQEQVHSLPLDPVYTGKMMFGIYDLIRRGEIPPGSVLLMIHSGGLQGRRLSE